MRCVIKFGRVYSFEYRNHRGEVATRTARAEALDFDENEWYPELQWLLRSWDFDKNAARSFALNNINVDTIVEVPPTDNARFQLSSFKFKLPIAARRGALAVRAGRIAHVIIDRVTGRYFYYAYDNAIIAEEVRQRLLASKLSLDVVVDFNFRDEPQVLSAQGAET
ncbi:hypothetical protein Kuura_037 [Caulobacter phage Kuura]|nr:hypothetical protein Kuura_037 [Caulobacter phage Kuura]